MNSKYPHRSGRPEFGGFDPEKERQRSLQRKKSRALEGKRKAAKKKKK